MILCIQSYCRKSTYLEDLREGAAQGNLKGQLAKQKSGTEEVRIMSKLTL